MDIYGADRNYRGRARERIAARRRRQMATPARGASPPSDPSAVEQHQGAADELWRGTNALPVSDHVPRVDIADRRVEPRLPRTARRTLERRRVASAFTESDSAPRRRSLGARLEIALHDLWWYVRHDRRVGGGVLALIGAVAAWFVLSHVLGNRIFPNVSAMGIHLGGLTVDEAAGALQRAWDQQMLIALVDEARTWEVTPAQLGLRLNARATAEAARAAGMSGIPFGYEVLPTVEMDLLRTQNTLLDYTETTKILAYNAGYRWEGDRLVGVPGSPGRFLDVAATIQRLEDNLAVVAQQRRLDLVMTPVSPEEIDPAPYLALAQSLASQQFLLIGYDPFRDERLMWSTDRDTFASWLEVGAEGLTLREDAFAPFLQVQTESLAQTDPLRYFEPTEAMNEMREAINEGRSEVSLRIRYRTSQHVIERGDTGYRLARQRGVPFYLLEQANPGRDWNALLSPGEVINLPSPDSVVPLEPVMNKRIIVDLETQTLWAYENGQLVFNWLISSGMERAPTSPGIYQILSHEATATGSSVELCGDNSCGSWEMYWFMGIYEVVPGLVNGFHGAVLLPNGAYLGGGNVGAPYTYGCIMSENGNAEALYHWADEGTIVEIISSEFPPVSQLGQQALTMARSMSGSAAA